MLDNTRNFIIKMPSVEWPSMLLNQVYQHLEKFKFLSVTLKHPYLLDTQNIDIFSIFEPEELTRLKTSAKTYFFFDYLKEGTSYKWVNYYELITDSAIKHDIPFDKIIFGSSNLLEQQSYDQWCQETNQTNRFKIFNLNFWDGVFAGPMLKKLSIDQTVADLRNNSSKYFLFLNRRKRPHRLFSIFQLYQTTAFNKGLVSCDRISEQDYMGIDWHLRTFFDTHIDKDKWDSLVEKTPLVLDFFDFKVNWADTMPDNLFKKTLFSLVNETLIEEKWIDNGPSLFYSEKTFKPMLYNHPVLIFGQRGANQQLKSLGYRTYDKYFNLDFDLELNTIDRINAVVSEVDRISSVLDSLSLESKIEWILQDRETIEHNKEVMQSQNYNFNQAKALFDLLEQESN